MTKTMQTRNVWILGGTGYIGSALLRHLSADRANRLQLLIHRSAPYRRLERFNTFTASLATIDPLWFERYPPDVVFHLARPAGSLRISRAWAAYRGEKANRRLAAMLERLENPPVVVYVSGSLLYGPRPADDPAVEESPLAPAAFARYYRHNEQPWLEAQERGVVDVRFARPAWIVGAGSWFRKFFYEPMLRSGKVPYYGNGQQLMSLIHLNDCGRLIDALSRYGSPGKNLNVFAGEAVSQRHFAHIVGSVAGCKSMAVPVHEARKRYGSTAVQALTASIPLRTMHPEVVERAGIRFRDHERLVSDVLHELNAGQQPQ